jgi:hypothetical protein
MKYSLGTSVVKFRHLHLKPTTNALDMVISTSAIAILTNIMPSPSLLPHLLFPYSSCFGLFSSYFFFLYTF